MASLERTYRQMVEQRKITDATDLEDKDKDELKDISKALNKSTKAHAKQAKYLDKLVKKDKDTNEENNLEEGTWHMPDTPKDIKKIISILGKPLPVGDEENAYEGSEQEAAKKMNALGKAKVPIGDDRFYDEAYELSTKKGPRADLRPLIIDALVRFGMLDKKGTPAAVISALNMAMKKAMNKEQVNEAMNKAKRRAMDKKMFKKLVLNMGEETLGEELTMMSHGGEQTHIISGMKHNQHNADKAMHATVHAAAKHAGVHVDKIKHHQEIMSNVMDDEHHYMRHEPVKKGTSSDDKAGRGGHGEVVHHKDLASYVNHHAKNDAQEYKDRHHYYEESVQVQEAHSAKEVKMAIGIASDPRYAKGNMTGAVKAIEKMKKGLSSHPQVAAVLKRQNEQVKEMTTSDRELDARFAKLSPRAQSYANELMRKGDSSAYAIQMAKQKFNEQIEGDVEQVQTEPATNKSLFTGYINKLIKGEV